MHVGVIGAGIVGTTIAATLKKQLGESVSVTLIDDERPYQTSKAGQGYLFSIHRSGEDLASSLEAKEAWMELIDDDIDRRRLFDTDLGSLLVTTAGQEESNHREALRLFYEEQSRHLSDLEWVESVQDINPFARPSLCGIYYPHDVTLRCTPPQLMTYLRDKYNLPLDVRTVDSLDVEQEAFDQVVCCTGPWINELQKDAGVLPVRGVLLKAAIMPGSSSRDTVVGRAVPMMEFGYGSLGKHFTLSIRDGAWLVGASREDVGFSMGGVGRREEELLRHASKFVLPGVVGTVQEAVIGFRPSLLPRKGESGGYRVRRLGNKCISAYGFEGQGVLNAAKAAKDVLQLVTTSPP